MDVVAPSGWSRWPHLYDAMQGEDPHPMDGWVCHWPGTPGVDTVGDNPGDEIRALQSYERYHVETKGWRGIAYDWMIGQSGTVYAGRQSGRSGATSGDYDRDGIPNNRETDGVLFIVGLDEEVTDAAIRAFVRLVESQGGPRNYLLPHNQASTARQCPGVHVMEQVTKPAQDWTTFAARWGSGEEDDMPYSKQELEDIAKAGALAALAEDYNPDKRSVNDRLAALSTGLVLQNGTVLAQVSKAVADAVMDAPIPFVTGGSTTFRGIVSQLRHKVHELRPNDPRYR